MESVSIVIAGHHRIVRDGINMILTEVPGMMVSDAVSNREELLSFTANGGADILVLDLDMPDLDMYQTIRRIKEDKPEIRILCISDVEEADQIKGVMAAGVSGYMLKKRGKDEMIEAIRVIQNGNRYLCEETIKALVQNKGSSHIDFDLEKSALTERELEILRLICKEYTNRESAEELGISVRTVDAHRRALLQKTGARNTAGLVKFAVKNKIFNL